MCWQSVYLLKGSLPVLSSVGTHAGAYASPRLPPHLYSASGARGQNRGEKEATRYRCYKQYKTVQTLHVVHTIHIPLV